MEKQDLYNYSDEEFKEVYRLFFKNKNIRQF